ncbi:MAG: barstar family protein [Tannerella sp.]|jgi:RNAse (barnase) inhibitor barstar|nr:barstar family protein [Tannerella sp.]
MKQGEFYYIEDEKALHNQNNSYLVKIDCINSKEELLSDYSIKLKFPSYFGFNWDVLRDCLSYLENIAQNAVIIYHQELPKLKESDLITYLEILSETVIQWQKYEEHDFEVYFNMQDYDKVYQLIG